MKSRACGKPVMASNIGGLGEIIVDYKTGYLVDGSRLEATAQRIVELLEYNFLRQGIGKQAQEKLLSEFSREEWIQKIEGIY